MSAPTLLDDRAVGAPERLHPLFLLTGLGRSLRGIAGGYAAIGYLAVSGRLTTALIGAVALLVIMVVGIVLYWRRFEYRVGTSEIRIDSGILSRTHRSIPFQRIQDVDITQGPIARLLGLAQVKFETGGSGGAAEDEGALHAITLERAQQIRALIRERRSGAAAATPAAADDDWPPVYAMSVGRLLLAGTFNFSLAVFAGLFGLTQTFGDALGFDPLNRSFWIGLLSAGHPLADYILRHRFVAALAGAVLLLLLGLATGVVRTLLRDWGFRLDQTEAGLRRRRGLFTRTDVTLPVKRVQAVIVGSGPIRDRFGWSDLHVQNLAQEEGGRGNHLLAPLATAEELAHILDELGWRPFPERLEWNRVSRAYVSMRLVTLGPLFLVAVLQGAASALLFPAIWQATSYGTPAAGMSVLAPTIVLLAILTVAILSRWFAWRRTSYAVDSDRLMIRTGWWRRRLVVLPASKIQNIDLTETFFSRWFDVATLRFGVAGGGMQAYFIPAIPRQRARQLRNELLESGA